MNAEALLEKLPEVRGRLTPMAPMANVTWLRVGGPAEILFMPADADDLAAFLAATPEDVPVTPIGVGSNVIIRDGGVEGVVIRLGRGFNEITTEGLDIRAGAAALDSKVAQTAAQAGIAGLEFLRGVPGAMGGAVRMNAGAYGRYIADIFVEADAITRDGRRVTLTPPEMGFAYRDSAPRDLIYTEVRLRGGGADAPEAIAARMEELMDKRAAAQPVKDRTAGSTFRNPAGYSSTGAADDPMELKAWALIDKAGCRGLTRGGAIMSEKHSNFLTNAGGATAADLEGLGEEVRRRVQAHSGVMLEWEIQRIGKPSSDTPVDEAAES
ncbi:MAG: UDP-N-acetylmuramate dehydrogenase [Neomegalonema sp.]|nr:UDP-N-acetylmuramate dehydrogenase [Neomegalonema sp.]